MRPKQPREFIESPGKRESGKFLRGISKKKSRVQIKLKEAVYGKNVANDFV